MLLRASFPASVTHCPSGKADFVVRENQGVQKENIKNISPAHGKLSMACMRDKLSCSLSLPRSLSPMPRCFSLPLSFSPFISNLLAQRGLSKLSYRLSIAPGLPGVCSLAALQCFLLHLPRAANPWSSLLGLIRAEQSPQTFI